MRRYLPQTLNQWLLAAVPLSLVVAWPLGYWTVGAAVALGALCALAVRNPQQEFVETWPWLSRVLGSKQQPESKPERKKTVIPLPPPRRHVRKDKNMSPVQQMLAQGRVALLLRPQI